MKNNRVEERNRLDKDVEEPLVEFPLSDYYKASFDRETLVLSHMKRGAEIILWRYEFENLVLVARQRGLVD